MQFALQELFRVASAVALLGLLCGEAASSRAADRLTPIDLGQVKVGGEIGRRIDVTINNNLLVLDAEKDFLQPFRVKNSNDGYVGLGKLIDAAVRFAAYTKNDKVIALKKHLIEEVLKTQESDGYIGIMSANARIAHLWDIHEMGYMVYGLTSDYHFFGEKRSLASACKMADYILANWKKLPADWAKQTQVATNVSVTGIERTLLALYRETKDRRYLDFCLEQRAIADWDLGIVVGRREMLEGHVYAYLARCLAQLELYHLEPDAKLLNQTRRAVDFMTKADGLSITGGAGQWEIWTDDQDGRTALGETCATAYQLRVYNTLLQMEGDPRYADWIERTIYNALFAAQSPDGRRIRYYSPVEGCREYHPTDTYCCPCNYRRIIAELPEMIYYRSGNGLAVSLYTASEASMKLENDVSLKIRQETDYPTSGRVMIELQPSKPAKLALQLRIPRWCVNAVVTVNGQPLEKKAVSGEFFSIERIWNAGDRVTLELPMPWRFVLGRKRQAGRAAVMRGPMVYCLNPARIETLAKLDAADVGGAMLYPASIKGDKDSKTFRPGGTSCTIKAGTAGYDMWSSGNLSLLLTEFPDPEGKCVYFRLPDLSGAVPDELFGGK